MEGADQGTSTDLGRWGEPATVRLGVMLWRLGVTALAAAGVVLEHGFYEQLFLPWKIHAAQALLLLVYAADVFGRAWLRRVPMPGAGVVWTDRVLFVVAGLGAVMRVVDPGGVGWHLVEVSAASLCFAELWRTNVALSRSMARPGLLLPLSFGTLIVVGTLLIKTPVAVPQGHPELSWVDALFTMTSAVCVTGLTVQPTATAFTPFGHLLIGIFIQLGGLGIIIFGTLLVMLLGRSLSLREHMSLGEMLESQPLRNITGFVRFIVLTTLGIELAGAAVMMGMWDTGGADWSWQRYVGMSLFHAVSAFCNAGFDLTGDSLEAYRYSPLTHVVVLVLVVVGGIGFPVLNNLRWSIWGAIQRWRGRAVGLSELARCRLSLHTKLVLTTTAWCYLLGVVFIGAGQLMPYFYEAFEQGQTAHVERPGELTASRVVRVAADASFMSLATRTAGFNTVPTEQMSKASHFAMMALMVVGGSPGSTAGGAKTTVVALLVLSVIATIRNRSETEAFGRTMADALVRRAATIGICFMLLIGVSTLLLCYSESSFPFERIFFEAVSASGTVGLSMGITEDLTTFGKGVIIGTMFLGRVGPLTLLAALLFRRRTRRPYAFAHEDVGLG